MSDETVQAACIAFHLYSIHIQQPCRHPRLWNWAHLVGLLAHYNKQQSPAGGTVLLGAHSCLCWRMEQVLPSTESVANDSNKQFLCGILR